ncbi:Rossmann-like and DUF2520 domain-containing protein [Hathewaya massiliensis]|uniref:Rossmann-like and DUF2520 domain-containing protein n=1 Tax=Hathewaya massiliensis TaxID=1964382 RepID=UPI0011578AF4|nr:Rossmann-like and DUF2520 domain-containing protein [Hathewaya massiliensis]
MFNNISFIGAGKVGCNLAKYFMEKGYNINGFFCNSLNSKQFIEETLNLKTFSSLHLLVKSSDAIFITTPDDEIKNIWNILKETKDLNNKFLVHVSGSLNSDVFTDINKFGAYGFSVHPMWPFSDKHTSYKGLKEAYFSIEGNIEKIHTVEKFINSLGNNSFIISKEHKTLYHAANVAVSNLVLSLINLGTEYLSLCGIDENNAKDALMPLILNNINSIKEKGFIDSLTGPIERLDLGTIEHHLSVIPQEHIDIYKGLSLNLVKLSKEKNPNKNYKELEKILQEEC